MISEIITASFLGGLPIAVFTFLILQWSIASGRLERFEKADDIEASYERAAKAKKAADKQARAEKKAAKKAGITYDNPKADQPEFGSRGWFGNIFHDKLMSFGAGFYGTMAVFTYLIIEVDEIFEFLGKLGNITALFSSFGVDLIIAFFINSIMNFVYAMIWFITLPKYFPVEVPIIWLGAAYLGYLAGIRLVTQHGDALWERLGTSLSAARTKGKEKLNAVMTEQAKRQAAKGQKASPEEKSSD